MEEFGNFWLEERLDAGGEFAFFRATRMSHPHRARGEPCVVLRASRESAEDRWPPWAAPELAEVLRHPTIVRMLDHGYTDTHRYFSFEFVDGADARHVLRGAPLPRGVALFVTRAILEALCAASAAVGFDGTRFEYWHGSISPRWVFVSRRGQVKLGGFGLGYLKPELPRELAPVNWNKVAISAPEQLLEAEGVTAQTDMFQVGLLLHRMLFGSEFISGALARMLREVKGRPVAATALAPTDPQLGQLLRRLLAERPKDRFASIHEAREAINHVAPVPPSDGEAQAWLAARMNDGA